MLFKKVMRVVRWKCYKCLRIVVGVESEWIAGASLIFGDDFGVCGAVVRVRDLFAFSIDDNAFAQLMFGYTIPRGPEIQYL